MKKISLFLLGMLLALVSCSKSLTEYVDPMIGTGGHGHVFLGANVPFGFVQWVLQSLLAAGTGVAAIIIPTRYWWASPILISVEPAVVIWVMYVSYRYPTSSRGMSCSHIRMSSADRGTTPCS